MSRSPGAPAALHLSLLRAITRTDSRDNHPPLPLATEPTLCHGAGKDEFGRRCRVVARPPRRQTMTGRRAEEEKGSPGEDMLRTPRFLHPRLASAQSARRRADAERQTMY